MPETIGTLNLKIARLESRLNLLEKQQVLSSAYPNHQINLVREISKVRFQLHQLIQYREKLLQRDNDCRTERLLDGNRKRRRWLYSTN
jgi:metal-responsive CopG/Arc/MetJ family transcriptional regulator